MAARGRKGTGIPRQDTFLYRTALLQRKLPAMANRSGVKTAAWLADMGKQTTGFFDRTGSLRKSIKAGLLTAAKKGGSPVAEVTISAGYDDVGYTRSSNTGASAGGMRPKSGQVVKTSEYAASVELGGPNPWKGRNNPPHPYLVPTMDLAHKLEIWAGFFRAEWVSLQGFQK